MASGKFDFRWRPVEPDGRSNRENYEKPLELLKEGSQKILIDVDIFDPRICDFERLQVLGVVALSNPMHKFVVETKHMAEADFFLNEWHHTNQYDRNQSEEGWAASGEIRDRTSDRAARFLAGYVDQLLVYNAWGVNKPRENFKWPLPNLEIREIS